MPAAISNEERTDASTFFVRILTSLENCGCSRHPFSPNGRTASVQKICILTNRHHRVYYNRPVTLIPSNALYRVRQIRIMKHTLKTHSHHDWRTVVIAAIVLLLLPSMYYGLAIRSYVGTYSPFDEHTHMGYAWSISHGNIPAKGDLLPKEVLNDLSCSGYRSLQDKINNTIGIPACNSNAPADSYPGEGEQYNSFHPPLYYIITGILARIISSISDVSFEYAARYLSIVWMDAGIVALFFSLRKWEISTSISLATCALIPFIPVFLNPGSAVTNDAPALLCGAGFLWIAAQFFVHKRYNPLFPCTLAFLSCMIKATFAFTLLSLLTIIVIFSLFGLLQEKDRQESMIQIGSSILIGLSALLSIFAWNTFQSHRGDPDYTPAIAGTNSHPVQGLPFGEFLNTFLSGFNMSVLPAGDLRGSNASIGYAAWLVVLSIVISGAAFFLYFQNDSIEAHQKLIFTAILGMALFPALVQIREYLGSHSMFGSITPRYGMSLIPFIVCCWALTVQNRKQPILAWCVSGLGVIVCFVSVLDIAPYSVS